MRFEHTLTSNWENSFRGLRHPYESYNKSDSCFGITHFDDFWDIKNDFILKQYPDKKDYDYEDEKFIFYRENGMIQKNYYEEVCEYALLGKNDLDLAQRMIKAGTPNDKFLRQIFVSVDITAPRYWWIEADTYKVGTTANSTSTMHKLATTPIMIDCFEISDFWRDVPNNQFIEAQINFLEELRQKYLETKDVRYWKELIRWLPAGWLQTRTWTANYSVLRNIIHWRKNHRLKYEWDSFINWCETLPYSSELLFYEN